MDSNEVAGAAKKAGGKIKEYAGSFAGDAKTQASGYVDQATGAAQKAYGQAADVAGDYASQLLDQIEEAGDYLAEQIDERPITSLLIAGAVGFLVALVTKPKRRYR